MANILDQFIPIKLINGSIFSEDKFSRTRRLIEQQLAIGIESNDVIGYLDHLKRSLS
jgi:hypothetical protein